MRLFSLTILALFLFILSSTASAQSPIESLHEQAYKLLDTDLDLAMTFADSSLLLAQELDLSLEEANSYYIKGYIFWQKNNLPKALVMYLRASAILDPIQADEQVAKMYIEVILNTGVILRKYSKYEEALEVYESGLVLATKWKIRGQQLNFLYNEAYCLRKQNRTQEALEILKETTTLANRQGNDKMLLKSFNLIGLVHKDGGNYEMSREYFQYILGHSGVTPRDKAMAYHNIATTYREEGMSERAKDYLDQALAIKRELNNPSLLFTTLYGLAEWHLEQNNLEDASTYANEAESLYASLFSAPETFDIFYLQGNIYEVKRAFEKAKNYADEAYEESKLFIAEQQAIIEELKSFQMDLILAGFQTEQLANDEQRKATRYQWLALASGLLIILVWIGWKTWFNSHRRQLGRKIGEIVSEMETRL